MFYIGIVTVDMFLKITGVVMVLCILSSFACVIVAIRFIIVSAKYSHKYVLTAKGNKLRKEILGLKKYLKDYSLIKQRTAEEVKLWEYYLIYAVVTRENFKVEDKIIAKFVKKLNLI
jgi:uncharacterized membrane protein